VSVSADSSPELSYISLKHEIENNISGATRPTINEDAVRKAILVLRHDDRIRITERQHVNFNSVEHPKPPRNGRVPLDSGFGM